MEIDTRTTAKLLGGISIVRVSQMFSEGVFKTAYKPGHGKNAHWRVSRAEVLAHKINNHAVMHQ